MKKRIQRRMQKFSCLPLNRKLSFIIFSVAIFISFTSLIGIWIVSGTNRALLYKTTSASVSYSAKDIASRLDSIKDMTDAMIADSSIQKSLSTIKDSSDPEKRKDAYDTLSSKIYDYYHNYKNNGIWYLNLYNSYYTTYSYKAHSDRTPVSVQEYLKKAALLHDGYPAWITAFSDDYGIFLTRIIRRSEKLQLDTLGTALVSVDMDKLIQYSIENSLGISDALYVISDGRKNIYASQKLTGKLQASVKKVGTSPYGVIRNKKSAWFYVQDTIPGYDWKYTCLIPYNTVLSNINTVLFAVSSAVFLATAVGFFISRQFTDSITRHFSYLINKMKAFEQDELSLPDTKYNYSARTDEIGQLHQQFDHMALKIRNLIQENYVQELLAKDAKLKALQNQINPHFLYNTLDSIYWRARACREDEISTMIESLSALLRVTLSKKDTIFVVSQEMDLVHHFIAIQQIRFEQKLVYTDDISPEILNVEIPQFTIQPLVENAITYSLEEFPDICHIHVHGYITDSQVIIQVINSGTQFEDNFLEKLASEEVRIHGFGIGLMNIHKRLQIIYGKSYGLSLYNQDEDHAVAQICIPFKK